MSVGKYGRRSMTRMEQPISYYEKAKAIKLWDLGRSTLEIARILKMPEFQIYNGLWRWRAGLGL